MVATVPILFEDEHLIVVDKPARMLVVGAPGRRGATIVDRLRGQLGEPITAVHRLDEDTTGVLVLARTEAAAAALTEVFRTHAADRIYRALIDRVPSPSSGRIESRVVVGRDGIVRSVRDGDGARGDHAVTEYRTLARRGRHALVECRLHTGRRNQIRVHMAELRCPVVGDRKYGFRAKPGRGTDAEPVGARRVLLHAWRVRFEHPLRDGVVVDVCVEPREDVLRFDDGGGGAGA